MKTSHGTLLWRLATLAIIATMVLTACGQTATDTPAPAQPTSAPQIIEVTKEVEVTRQVEVQVTPEVAPEGGPVLNPDVSGDVEFWHFWASPVRRNAVRRVIAICKEKLPNINVTDTVKPFGDIWTANIAAVAAGSGMPDVIVEDRPKLPQTAADGIETNLQEWADRDGVDPAAFWPFTWQQTLYEGDTYGIPFETDVRVLFYNKNLFTQAGLDPNTPPKTWDELWEMADKLDKKNDAGEYERIAFYPLIGNASPEVWGYTNGVNWFSEDQTPMINDPKAVETVDWVKKWVDRYGGWANIQKFVSQFGAPPNDAFMSGKVAMYADIAGYNSTLTFYRPYTMLDDGETRQRTDWGVSLLPYGEAPGSWSGGFALSIPTGAKNPEAAWEFIKCASGMEASVSWARDTAAQPTLIEAANDPVLMADPLWPFFIEALGTSTGGVYVTKYPNWGEQLSQRYEKVWTGEITAQQMLDEAQKAVEDTIAATP